VTSTQSPSPAPTPPPAGWLDWSAYRFLAPEKKQITGRLLPGQMQGIRGQLTVTWEDVEESKTLDELLAERPLPMGINAVSEGEVPGHSDRHRRVYRFADPLRGFLIQRSETYIKDGKRLYVMALSASPLDFAACEAEIQKSKRTIQLLAEAVAS
jgi:hypothetical protein